jgi:4-hydroxy-tetrahydrodipicolinate synthase
MMHKTQTLFAKGEYKQWAREYYKGMENLLLPSFTPDFTALDEDGIRRDVRQSIKHGFFSTGCVAPLTTLTEYKRTLEIACEEANGKMLVGAYVGEPTREANLELLAHAAKIGCSHAVLVPRYLEPQSEEEIYAWYRDLIDHTNIPIVLYAQNNARFRHLHPSGIPLAVFERLADLPTIVAVKLTQAINLVRAMECGERLGNKILVGPVHLDMMPLLSKACHIQWSGQWNAECAQSPEKPYIVQYLDAIARGRMDEAYKLYWALEPAYRAFFQLQAPLLLKGGHPWAHIKYNQWCVGGNGGLMRDIKKPVDTVPVLTPAAREQIRNNYRQIGITPTEGSDEQFMVGMANHAKGVRRSDLTDTPLYE